MKDLNGVQMIGRLTRDCETSYTTNGACVVNFSIAVNGSKKVNDQWEDKASFFDCVFFGKLAEKLAQYLVKGKQVAITGELEQDRWTNAEGQNRSKVKIKIETIQMVGGRSQERDQEAAVPAVTQGYQQPQFEDKEDIPF